jgi:5-oxoprolinase (ATP-hydrolysing) subunit A
MTSVDLNCDMGEFPDAAALALQESLMPHITSSNIACGGHAGDDRTMRATVGQALRWNVAIGAHPGYPDPANFGRLDMAMPGDGLADSVARQVARLAGMAAAAGAALIHVKPHGALYNRAARDAAVARAIMQGVGRVSRSLVLVGLAGSVSLDVFREGGFPTASEAFADRCYEPGGTLRSRRLPGALIEDPETAAAQALQIVRGETPIRADTICIHSDTPGALRIAQAVHQRLGEAGVILRAITRRR